MASIIINERDDTLPGSSTTSTDVVFVPGFSDTNLNCYVSNVAGAEPNDTLAGSVVSDEPTKIDFNSHNDNPEFYVNTFDRTVWYCSGTDSTTIYDDATFTDDSPTLTGNAIELDLSSVGACYEVSAVSADGTGYDVITSGTPGAQEVLVTFESGSTSLTLTFNSEVTTLSGDLVVSYKTNPQTVTTYTWAQKDSIYQAPCVENEPVLFTTVSEFKTMFGDEPYKFTASDISGDRGKTPNFTINSTTKQYDLYSADDYEKSYIYARELLYMGIPVLYYNYAVRDVNGKKALPSVSDLYGALSDILEIIKDRGQYSVKYVTSGAYPVFELTSTDITTKMLSVASGRGDATAIIDHMNIPGRDLTGDNSVYAAAGTKFNTASNSEYGAMFTPWAYYTVINEASSVGSRQLLPASFGYLISLAKSVKTNANWLAVAGVSRGVVPNIISLNTSSKLTNSIADSYQKRTGVSINAITNINPYGLTIWGNRTLLNNKINLTAHSFLNTRNMVNDIKKVIYTTAKSLLFEQNSEQLWLSFKSGIMPTLNKMQSGQGLSGYKIIRDTTDEKAKLVATVKLYPIYAVEDFEITVVLKDEEVNVQ